MGSRTVALAVLAFVAPGCGSAGESMPESALPAELSREVRVASEAISRDLDEGDGCAAAGRAARLQARTIRAINAGDVPGERQEELQGAVNELAESIPCPPREESHAGHTRDLIEALLEMSRGSG